MDFELNDNFTAKFENMLRGRKFLAMLDCQSSGIREKYDLKNSEIYVILYLSNNKECNTAKEINDYLNLTKGYTSKVLDSLCQKGYITAVPDEKDRRYVHYTLNDSADSVIKAMKEAKQRIKEVLLDGISAEELEAVKAVTIKINDNMDRLLK